MQLHPQDLALLYGTHLYLIADAAPTQVAQQNEGAATATPLVAEPLPVYATTQPDTPASSQAWLNPSGNRLSLVLAPAEHTAPACQDLLSKIMQALGLPSTAVSTHPTAALPSTDILAAAPALHIVGFGIDLPGVPNKKTYSFASLTHMLTDQAAKRTAWDAMKLFKAQL